MSQPMFCVCLVLGLLFIAANGVPPDNTCTWSWFGENCTLQCHCNHSAACSSIGECPLNVCKKGYFGPGCQYLNLAEPSADNPSFLTDNDEDTCNPDQQTTSLFYELPASSRFFWLRLIRRRSATSRDIEVRLNDQLNSCPNYRVLNHTIPQTVDVMCDVRVLVRNITIKGGLVPWICSLEYGAGRNAALLQHAEQISTDFSTTPASLAVDGDTGNTNCARTRREPGGAYWSVTFTLPHVLYKVRLFFKYDPHQPDGKFTLKTLNEKMVTVEEYREYDPLLNPTVDLTMHSIFPVKHLRVQGMANVQPSRGLTLCEVQAFGVQVCPEGFYGLFCHDICSCDPYELCDSVTGGCSGGCPDGFYGFQCEVACPKNCRTGRCNVRSGSCRRCAAGYVGDTCDTPCLDGTYGFNCTESCPKVCGERRCDPVVGTCFKCKDNFVPPQCQVCISGRYGQNCTQSCPANCADNLCNNITGVCFKCKEQFEGDMCEGVTADPSELPWLYIIAGILFFIVLILLLILCLWKRSPQPQPVEERRRPVAVVIPDDDIVGSEEVRSTTITKDSDSEGSSKV